MELEISEWLVRHIYIYSFKYKLKKIGIGNAGGSIGTKTKNSMSIQSYIDEVIRQNGRKLKKQNT